MNSSFAWWYFVLGILAGVFLKLFILSINRAIIDHRQKKFLKLVAVRFPDRSKIAFIALDTSDKRAMVKLERQIREEFDLSEEPEEDRPGDSEFEEVLHREDTRHREDPPQ